jgi:excisionase family DNA binding protein
MENLFTTEASLQMTKIAIGVSSIFHAAAKLEDEKPVFIEQACEITGYAKTTIYSLINRREMPFHKVAGRQRLWFYKSELINWMAKSNAKEVQP